MASSDLPSVSPLGFRAEPADVYAFVARFFAGLRDAGVEHVVISPGSRSTPLAIGAARCRGLRSWIELDERCAAFFALGLARASGRPAALICTSGTAAANYLPAIVEAHYGRVPLLALTADRPPELRDWGAGQTIDQPGLYGRYPRWSVEVPVPTAGEAALRLAARLAARAVECAVGGPAGPVHLNWPLREPLAPPARAAAPREPRVAPPSLRFGHAIREAREDDVADLAALARRHERGVICCGPMDAEPRLVAALAEFARSVGWPVLAGPVSQLRGAPEAAGAPILSTGDALLRAPRFASRMRPDVVLRLGETPVSKAQRLWIEASAPAEVWWLDDGSAWGEPSHRATRVVRGGAASLLERAATALTDSGGRSRAWLEDFERAEAVARRSFETWVASPDAFSGLAVAHAVSRGLPAGATLFASNSMAIRLLDLVYDGSAGPARVLCSRGASGIDGINSTALGIAAGSRGPTLLLTGDLAFLHDLSGLLATRQADLDCVIVVLDDDGGGIFSFLPIAEQGEAVAFERLFGTPHGLDLARVADLFSLGYRRAETAKELDDALSWAWREPGVRLVHVPLDRSRGGRLFREALASIGAAVDAEASP